MKRFFSRRSFKRQIILTFTGGFFFLVVPFAGHMVNTESAYLYHESEDSAQGLARSLAVSSRSWVLAYDLAGLQEVVHSFQSYPELRYAMVISPSGQVLAHSDASKTGLFLSDATSLTLLQAPPTSRVLRDTKTLVDVAVPIEIDGRPIGWARIGLGRDSIAADLHSIVSSSIVFVCIAFGLSLLAAFLIASRLGYRIGALVRVAEDVQAGNFSTRAVISNRKDELSKLADSLNLMLDTLAQNEKDLHSASRYTRSLIEACLDPLVTISPEGKITDVNRASETATGLSRTELIGTDFSDYFTEPERAREGYRSVFLNGLLTDYPLSLRHKDGHVMEVLYNASVYRDDTGTVQGVFAAARDITERKRADATRMQLSAIVESSNDAIIGKTLDGIITHWNKAAEKIYGYTAAEIVGQSITVLADPARHAEIQALLEKIRNGEMVVSRDSERIRKDGSRIHVALTLSPIRDAFGKVTGISTIARDITERKRAEDELTRYRDHLEELVDQRTADLLAARNAAEAANRAKSIFLANMSHELRTPLNAILGFSGLMRKDPSLPESQRQYLDIVNRSGEHLLTLINDVLDMAKIEAGRVQLENAPFDLGLLMRDTMDMMKLRAQEKGLLLLTEQSSQFPRYVVGDEARLRQVLINLVGNAIKFTCQGGVTVRLSSTRGDAPRLLIEVEDSGPGITPEDQQRIFKPFVQLDRQDGGNEGAGLGLAIARQFVQLMGGSIQLESTPGKGSLFRIDLPLHEVGQNVLPPSEAVEQRDVAGLAPGQPEYRILIVEDQTDNQLLLVKLMESIGFPVKVAENGQRGVELFQSWQPHLIWMDRRMPVMDGVEATRRIRRLPGGQTVKIVAVTASAFKEQKEELRGAGMDGFVRKPYRSGEIYECLSKQLGVRYRYNEAPEQKAAETLLPEMLSGLPEDLRQELRSALSSLESERIDAALRKVAALDPQLHKTLSRFAENFDYPAILKALPHD
ncbi:PAS domain S-box protein [Methylococcus mesophilus]|uniref:PAS domain S-box protein n=1 Tax=Methylococcus mesophilus TaxID=2993564 RepID=UPI00224B81FE|nr:PAS domain S-box protein [Methylococcus mesophilus]UZR29186.1 PAS domain S-box protein [Methylococcus mesophilus]